VAGHGAGNRGDLDIEIADSLNLPPERDPFLQG
jgi:hypothetical protein